MNRLRDAIRLTDVSHRYGDREAVRDVSFTVAAGEIFALLGPNGGGKTTLFRLLSTLIPLRRGSAEVFGFDVRRQVVEVRSRIGVVFQAPSLDKKLTVRENVRHQAALYGLTGREQRRREEESLRLFGLTDRADERTETLSGGLRRRVELAKGMIHHPRLLLLDEPSTGLDPGARADLWRHLSELRDRRGVTVVLTTHLLEEAERADRIAILDRGRLVALDAPDALRATVGGDSITIRATDDPASLAADLKARLGVDASVVDGRIRLEVPDGYDWIPRLAREFPRSIASMTVGRPTLEDVFVARTGHRFWGETDEVDR